MKLEGYYVPRHNVTTLDNCFMFNIVEIEEFYLCLKKRQFYKYTKSEYQMPGEASLVLCVSFQEPHCHTSSQQSISKYKAFKMVLSMNYYQKKKTKQNLLFPSNHFA